ncbi:2-C-methyl-D-erythritol 2,4-cyclodiphosphate synthase [Planctomycetales bacterium 10988]|nr:2-C-methyl-D-erythritol 2,4-cyclodiphosphate synthase [Planctomycetales bacterium 10988]
MNFRIGIGHDTHRLEPGGPLRLGGINIPHGKAAFGYSDADVLLHAVTDALLGAASLGDIGTWFPNTDPVNQGRDSGEMLSVVVDHLLKAGYSVGNIDCTVFAQRPRLIPYREQIRARIAELLHIHVEEVSFKAKTGERVGPIGREEAIQAEAIVLLYREK